MNQFTKHILKLEKEKNFDYLSSTKNEYLLQIEKIHEKNVKNLLTNEKEILKLIPKKFLEISAQELLEKNFDLSLLLNLKVDDKKILNEVKEIFSKFNSNSKIKKQKSKSVLKNNKKVKFILTTPTKSKSKKKFLTSTKKNKSKSGKKCKKNFTSKIKKEYEKANFYWKF